SVTDPDIKICCRHYNDHYYNGQGIRILLCKLRKGYNVDIVCDSFNKEGNCIVPVNHYCNQPDLDCRDKPQNHCRDNSWLYYGQHDILYCLKTSGSKYPARFFKFLVQILK